jgi:hypothetical protein
VISTAVPPRRAQPTMKITMKITMREIGRRDDHIDAP